jgi:hypothetical protein
MRGKWFQTFTGKEFYIEDPRTEDICIEDIAHALAFTCRFNGHSLKFYSVAQHSVLVSLVLPEELAFAGLLHDAAEAYAGDVVSPLKPSLGVVYAEIEQRLTIAIGQRFSVDPADFDHALVKQADMRALAAEARDIMAPPPRAWVLTEAPLSTHIVPVGPEEAEQMFLRRFHEIQLRRKDQRK